MITNTGFTVERAVSASAKIGRTMVVETRFRSSSLVLAALLTAMPAARSFAQSSSISVTGLPSRIAKFAALEATIPVFTTSATNNYWPYDSQVPVGDVTGLTVGKGVTVNALFLPPGKTNWTDARVQPCFWYQPMKSVTIDQVNVPTPNGSPSWRVRFAPDVVGTWKLKIQVTDATGLRQSSIYSLSCTASTAHGYIRVAPSDTRYFQFADGTPFVSGAGIAESNPAKFSLLAGGFKLNRVWWQASDGGNFAPFGLSGQGGAKDWSVQGTFTGPPTVTVPADRLIVKALSAGEVTVVNVSPGTAGKTYQWKALVKTVGLQGPASTNGRLGSNYGPALQPTDNAAGTDQPVNTQWLTGSNDWTWISGTYVHNFPTGEFRWMKIGIPNATAGTCYIAETSVREVLAGGALGPELAVHPVPNTLQAYSQVDAYNCDQQLNAAALNDLYLKIVCFEKQDVVTAGIQDNGTFGVTDDNNTYGTVVAGTINAQRWYQRAAMRYFAARWGWSPNVHSVEYLNEGDPFNGNHYAGANAFADYIHQVNARPILAATSFWHSLPTFWNTTSCDYLDVHKYIGPQSGSDLQDGYGAWNAAPTVADPVRGQVLPLVSDTVNDWKPVFTFSPMPVTPGHTYRVRFALKGEGLTKTDPNTGQTAPYPAGPGVEVRVYSGHTNAPTLAVWGPGGLVTSPNQEGTFDWEERVTPTFTVTSPDARYIQINTQTHWTYGTAKFDDIRLEDVTDPIHPILIPVPNGTFDDCGLIKFDTALQTVDAGQQYVGGGGTLPRPYNKPLIWGEFGISGDNVFGSPYLGLNYTGEEQRLYQDTSGVWLHKLIWAGVAPGGVTPVVWWNQAIYKYNLLDSARAFQSFMVSVPLNNGAYVDAQPVCSGGLRAWGQRDRTAHKAHLWIDNPDHTWGNVVNLATITPKTGTVLVGGFLANATYTVQKWDTRTGLVIGTNTVVANGTGTVAVPITTLATDLAVKIF